MIPYISSAIIIFSNNGTKRNRIFWRSGLCVKKLSLTKYVRDQKWARGKMELQRVLSFNRRTYACKTHQKYSVWFCKSFLLLFFPCTCRRGGTRGRRKCSPTMTGRVTRLQQLFTVRHVLSNKGTVERGRGSLGLDTLYRFGA